MKMGVYHIFRHTHIFLFGNQARMELLSGKFIYCMNFREFSRTASLITRGGYPPQETEETIVSDYMGSLHFGGRYLVFKAFHIEGIGLFSSSWILEDGFSQKPRTFDKDFFVTRFSC